VRFRICSLSISFGNVGLFNLRPGRALRWKVEVIGWEDQGVVCEKSAPPWL
jgi:hypothetical protein